MKAIYFNMRTSHGVETIDSVHAEDWATTKEFKKEIKNMLENYHQAGMPVYTSRRATKDWLNK